VSIAARTLPLRVQIADGESLRSWLTRLAAFNETSIGAVFEQARIDVPREIRLRQASLAWNPDDLERLSDISGVSPAALARSTLARWDGRIINIDRIGGRVILRNRWARGTGTRVCPECVAEDGGAWQLRWLLAWSFACTRHSSLLRDECPACNHPFSSTFGAIWRPAFPRQCGAIVFNNGGRGVCGFDISTICQIQLDAASPILAAQERILEVFENEKSTSASEVAEYLDDLRTLGAKYIQVLGHSELFRRTQLLQHSPVRISARQGTFPPNDASTMGASVALAIRVLDAGIDHKQRNELIRPLVRAQRDAGPNGTPSALKGLWGPTSQQLRSYIWSALSDTMSVYDQLRYQTPTFNPTEPTLIIEGIRHRSRSIPQLLWPTWSLLLQPAYGFHEVAFRSAMTVSLLYPGSAGRRWQTAQGLVGLRADKKRGQHILAAVWHNSHDDTLQALCDLAIQLDTGLCPIDYHRRRTLDCSNLLTQSQWEQACATDNRTPGSDVRHLSARRYLYSRLTGNPNSSALGALGTRSAAERSQITRFRWDMSQELLASLDYFARGFLLDRNIDEPVTWEPAVPSAGQFSGTRIENLDLQSLAQMRAEGLSLTMCAQSLALPIITTAYANEVANNARAY
jgi:hypothetical protein